jgi:uncharacterized Zn-finger protein
MSQHMLHEHQRHLCTKCGRDYGHAPTLHAHVKSSHGQPGGVKGVPCKICKKRLSDASALRKHMRTHSGKHSFIHCYCYLTKGIKLVDAASCQ